MITPSQFQQFELDHDIPDIYLMVWDKAGAVMRVLVDDEKLLRHAVKTFMEENVDSLLDLVMLNGADYTVCASEIRSWSQSSRTQRTRQHEIESTFAAMEAGDDIL